MKRTLFLPGAASSVKEAAYPVEEAPSPVEEGPFHSGGPSLVEEVSSPVEEKSAFSFKGSFFR